MKVVVQRVKHASVTIGGTEKSRIGAGMLVLLGISPDDTQANADWLVGLNVTRALTCKHNARLSAGR